MTDMAPMQQKITLPALDRIRARDVTASVIDSLKPTRCANGMFIADPTQSKNWPRAYAPGLKYGRHPGDWICPLGQQQKPCNCATCVYWRYRWTPREG